MKLTKNQIDKLNIELTMVLSAEDYAEAERKKLAEARRVADFKGFRKGNVPASLVKKVYGPQILADAVNEAIGTGLQKFVEEEKINILGEPLSSEKQPEVSWVDGEDFTFVFDIAVNPEVSVEVSAEDEVFQYSVTVSAKEKSEMAAQLKKYYESQNEEKTDEQLEKEAAERFKENYKAEAEWRLTKDIRNFYVNKAGVELPEAFLKRWLLQANAGKVTAEEVEKEFPGFVEDFKWQMVRNFLMKKYDFKITAEDLQEAAKANVSYQYAMYGINNVPEDILMEAVKNMMQDQKQIDRLAEQVEDKKVIEQLKSEIKITSKKISSEKFKALA